MATLLFLLAVFGLTSCFIVLRRQIGILDFKPFNCPLCMGFWIGLVLAFFYDFHPILLWAAAGSGASWIFNRYVTGEF